MKTAITSLTAALFVLLATAAQAQDAAAGEKKAAMCIGCHGIVGYQASFPEVYKVPKISGQTAKYISSALVAYRRGDRKHPSMRAIAGSLTDQDLADLAAYYEKHGAGMVKADAGLPAPSAQAAELLAKGACASCHGANFSKPIDASYPKIAGQNADYMYFALKSYQVEGNPQLGRANAVMAGQARQFKLAELKVLANYIGSLPGDLQTVPQSKFR